MPDFFLYNVLNSFIFSQILTYLLTYVTCKPILKLNNVGCSSDRAETESLYEGAGPLMNGGGDQQFI